MMRKKIWVFVLFFLSILSACYAERHEAALTPSSPEFPWPPPQPSGKYVFPDSCFRDAPTAEVLWRDVDKRLNDALASAGYYEKTYYAIPEGFAIVARLEQINSDGTPKEGNARGEVEVGPSGFSSTSYLGALQTRPPGFFRVFVFIVSPYIVGQTSRQEVADETADRAWAGLDRLPDCACKQPYTPRYVCTALV